MMNYKRFRSEKSDYKAKVGMVHICVINSRDPLPVEGENIVMNASVKRVKSVRILIASVFPSHKRIEITVYF